VSDARPITNITDFVCGNCWNSFSKNDPGVRRGHHLACPHCGHALPSETAVGDDVAALVRSAGPASDTSDSAPYPAAALREGAGGFPALDGELPFGWMDAPLAAGQEPAEFVAGDSAGGFDSDGPALRPDRSQSELMAKLRSAPKSDAGSGINSTGYLAGDELSVDTDEKTPLDTDVRVLRTIAESPESIGDGDLAAALAAACAVADDLGSGRGGPDTPADIDAQIASLAAAVGAPVASDAGSGSTAPPGAAATPDERAGDGLEHREWKLKAMGLTYNFHGLDALIGWATNKVGQPLSISVDGDVWKDFASFFAAYRGGTPVQEALDAAANPGTAPFAGGPGGGARATGRVPVARSGATEAVRVTAVGSNRPSAIAAPELGGASGIDAANPPLAGAAHRSTTTAPAQGGANGNGAIGPANSPSRRAPAVQRTPAKEAGNGAKIAVAVVVALIAMAALLHVLGVIRIPGLH
jgi:DNA-directed RNA polymerase subunit RPC12/RpoP